MKVSRSLIIATSLISAALLSGCDSVKHDTHSTGSFEITSIQMGKISNFGLKNTETGQRHDQNYVSYCYQLKDNVEVGTVHELDYTVQTYESGDIAYRFKGSKDAFCR